MIVLLIPRIISLAFVVIEGASAAWIAANAKDMFENMKNKDNQSTTEKEAA